MNDLAQLIGLEKMKEDRDESISFEAV